MKYNYKCVVTKNGKRYYKKVSGKWKRVSNKIEEKKEKGNMKFFDLVKKVKNKDVYMMIGNGVKNQFRSITEIKKILKKELKNIEKDSCFLYFGDSANKKNPDIGYLFQVLHEMRPDILLYMIQIDAAKSWGIPDFVKDVYWHSDYNKKCQWGGILNGKPCSNTKKWVNLNKYIKGGIKNVFIFGGGEITLDEFSLIQKHNIPYKYFPVERRYKGDKKTRITNKDSLKDRVGITFNKI
jgi:hypothetical protein